MVWRIPPFEILSSWPQANYVNPEKRGPGIYISSALFTLLGSTALALRLYARLCVRRWLGLDDLFVILGWVFAVSVTAIVIYSNAHLQWNQHSWDVTWPNVLESGKVLFILLQLWSASSGFTRFSLLCFYYRLVQHINWRRSTIVLHVVVVINVIFSVGNMLALCLACRPLNVLWSGELHPKCINLSNFLFSMAVATTVLEFIVAMLPVPVILTLQMDRKQKWSVAALLCMGLFTTLAGCIRNYYVWKGWFSSYDAFWTADPIWLSAEIENWVAIVCACAPALRPVLGRLIGQRPITTKDSTLRSDVQPFNDSFSQDDFQKSYREAYGNQQVWFDLEGIRTDHLGYSVKITGGNHSPDRQSIKRRRWLGAGCNFGGAPKCQRRVLLRQKSPQKECFSPDSSQTSKLSKTSETNKIGGIRVEVRRSTEINREEPDQSEYDEITC